MSKNMGNCTQCGSSVPDGQSICSMCMGDIDHGSDGHYENWAQEQMRKKELENEALNDQARYEAEQQAQFEAEYNSRHQGE